jgi:hypothetical protein
MYENPSDINVTFSKWEFPIVVHQCRMAMRQTVCRTAKTPRKTQRLIALLSLSHGLVIPRKKKNAACLSVLNLLFVFRLNASLSFQLDGPPPPPPPRILRLQE